MSSIGNDDARRTVGTMEIVNISLICPSPKCKDCVKGHGMAPTERVLFVQAGARTTSDLRRRRKGFEQKRPIGRACSHFAEASVGV